MLLLISQWKSKVQHILFTVTINNSLGGSEELLRGTYFLCSMTSNKPVTSLLWEHRWSSCKFHANLNHTTSEETKSENPASSKAAVWIQHIACSGCTLHHHWQIRRTKISGITASGWLSSLQKQQKLKITAFKVTECPQMDGTHPQRL